MVVSQNTKVWLHGLGAAFLGALGSSIGTVAVAPDRFNVTSIAGVKNVIVSSLVSGILAVGLYLTKSPMPALTVEEHKESKETQNAETGDTVKTETKTTTIQQQ